MWAGRTLTAELIRPFVYEILEGDRPELLVYWDGSTFICSDDYSAYLAYRALEVKRVPVIVMGEYPSEVFGLGQRGGAELLPNVTYRRSTLPSNRSDQDSVLVDRLRRDFHANPRDKLYQFIFHFHRHLNNPLAKERELHDLLTNGARDFAGGRFRVFSEVCLGKKYRVDLAVEVAGDSQRIILVELERASLPLFTKTGAPYAHVTHALQQVEDWLRFWLEHPHDVPNSLDPTIAPAGVVVLGRSSHLSEDDRRRLLSLNANRRVQLITYDDLIGRIENYATSTV